MKPETKKQIFAHLEIKGYSITHRKKTYLASHKAKTPFFMYDFGKGLLFYCMYNISEYAQKNRLEYLDYINRLNHEAVVAKFVDYDGGIVGQLWVYGVSNKDEFSKVLKMWENEFSLLPCMVEGCEQMITVESEEVS